MSQMVRNDSASIISSLQMDYGDSDEDDSSLTNSRNNSIDTKDDIKDIDLDELKIKQEKNVISEGSSQEENHMDIKTENSTGEPDQTSSKSENLLSVDSTEKPQDEDLKPEPLSSFLQQRVQINAAPSVDVEVKDEVSGTPLDEVISDDEDGVHHKRKEEDKEDLAVALSETASKESPPAQLPVKKTTRLVSYGPDEDFDDEVSESDSEVEINPEDSDENSAALSDPSALSRSFQNMSGDDIKIPPEPPGNCSRLLQNKIEAMYDKMRRDGFDFNRTIQQKKSFRNPSIYEKLIDFCNIDQKGTNFPPEIYDPHIWGKESFYDELDKTQRKDMERREREKKDKTKIEFVVGTKKSSSDGGSYPDEKKRKTKWDTQPSGIVKAPGVQGPGVVNLTATATGTKATVISAIGSLSKKSSK